MQKMKLGKGTGPLEVCTSVIGTSGKIVIEVMMDLFQQVFNGREMPDKSGCAYF